MSYTIAQINQMSQAEFVEALGGVFEHTPAIAHIAWTMRPFADVSDLHQKMVAVVQGMSQVDQSALILAHPDLGSKAKMAVASVQEQAGVGLDQLTPEEYDRFESLNQAYKDKFGFPFIVAVKNHAAVVSGFSNRICCTTSILEAFERRLQNTADAEMEQALAEIVQIAKFRLLALV